MDDHVSRFDRIEEKLDKMSDAIVSLARIEERMITLFKRMDMYDTKQIDMDGRVATVELHQAKQTGSTFWTDKVIWIIIAAGLGLLFVAGK